MPCPSLLRPGARNQVSSSDPAGPCPNPRPATALPLARREALSKQGTRADTLLKRPHHASDTRTPLDAARSCGPVVAPFNAKRCCGPAVSGGSARPLGRPCHVHGQWHATAPSHAPKRGPPRTIRTGPTGAGRREAAVKRGKSGRSPMDPPVPLPARAHVESPTNRAAGRTGHRIAILKSKTPVLAAVGPARRHPAPTGPSPGHQQSGQEPGTPPGRWARWTTSRGSGRDRTPRANRRSRPPATKPATLPGRITGHATTWVATSSAPSAGGKVQTASNPPRWSHRHQAPQPGHRQ